jgi:hypothetical protein
VEETGGGIFAKDLDLNDVKSIGAFCGGIEDRLEVR